MAVNTLAQLPFNTVHMHDEVGGEDNSTVIDVNDDQINEKYDQSLLDVSDPAINVTGSDSVINDDLHPIAKNTTNISQIYHKYTTNIPQKYYKL